MQNNNQSKRYKVTLDRIACIGAGPCAAVSPGQWYLDDDAGRKANITGGERNNDNSVQTNEFDEDELEDQMNAALSCPVLAIKIKDQKTGKELIS